MKNRRTPLSFLRIACKPPLRSSSVRRPPFVFFAATTVISIFSLDVFPAGGTGPRPEMPGDIKDMPLVRERPVGDNDLEGVRIRPRGPGPCEKLQLCPFSFHSGGKLFRFGEAFAVKDNHERRGRTIMLNSGLYLTLYDLTPSKGFFGLLEDDTECNPCHLRPRLCLSVAPSLNRSAGNFGAGNSRTGIRSPKFPHQVAPGEEKQAYG